MALQSDDVRKSEKSKENDELLKKLVEEIRELGNKIDKLSLLIAQDLGTKPTVKAREVQKKIRASSDLSYALGGICMVVAAVLLGFSKEIATLALFAGSLEHFYLYWWGSGCLLLSGCFWAVDGYIDSRYVDVVGTVKKVRFAGHEIELLYYWKRELFAIIAFIFTVTGFVLLLKSSILF